MKHRVTAGTAALADQEHFVYRCYDARGHLLYIGCSVNVKRRMQQHRAKGIVWWGLVARVETESHIGLVVAREAEEAAIRAERPLFNSIYINKSVGVTRSAA